MTLRATWLFEPFPAPAFSLEDLRGEERSLSALRGRPAVILLWATEAAPPRAALLALAGGGEALAQAGVGAVAIAVDAPEDLPKVRPRPRVPPPCPWSSPARKSRSATRS